MSQAAAETILEPSIEILLGEDHRAIDRCYDAYHEMKRTDPAQALDAFRKYKAALLRHIKCEEDLIFPMLARLPDDPASKEVPVLRKEHQSLVPLLMEVEKYLKQGTDASSSEKKLFEKLHEHNAREETRVYGPADEALSHSRKQEVAEALRSTRFFT